MQAYGCEGKALLHSLILQFSVSITTLKPLKINFRVREKEKKRLPQRVPPRGLRRLRAARAQQQPTPGTRALPPTALWARCRGYLTLLECQGPQLCRV
jgi:hypothetical protein